MYDCEPKHQHHKWTPEEDEKLMKIISSSKKIDWNIIAKKMHKRNARQCKDRWYYYLRPDVNNGEWSAEEDELLKEKVKELGTEWQKIAKFFNQRTNTNCKNRWLAMQREKQRKSKSRKIQSSELFPNISPDVSLSDITDELILNLTKEDEIWDIFSGIPSLDLL